MRYASLTVIFVNTPFEIDCKNTQYYWIGKINFVTLQKECIFAIENIINTDIL